jgi:hypothetical protein
MSEPSWNDFTTTSLKAAPHDSEFDTLCAEVFMGGSGKRLIEMLRARHFDTPFNPLAPERALALRISQQQFVRELELACERGLKANTKRSA